MYLSRHTATFDAPVKGISIAPSVPPEPPAPTFSEEEVQQRENAARTQATQQAQQEANQQIVQLRQQASTLQTGALQKLDGEFQNLIHQVNTRLPELVIALVKRVLVDVKIDADTVKAIVDETISEISSENEAMEVRLSPNDLRIMEWMVPQFQNSYPNLTFKEDAALQPGDCLLNSRFGLIDATVEKKLQILEQDLKADE